MTAPVKASRGSSQEVCFHSLKLRVVNRVGGYMCFERAFTIGQVRNDEIEVLRASGARMHAVQS